MADQRFAEIADLNALGLPANALVGISDDSKNAALQRASSMLASRMTPKFEPPYTGWGDDLRGYTCDVAAWLLLRGVRGADPEAPEMKGFVRAYEEALAWADNVGQGSIIPVGIVEASGDEEEGAPDVSSEPIAGYIERSSDGTKSEFE